MSPTRRAAYTTKAQVAGSAQWRSSRNHTVARSTAASSTTSSRVSYTTGRSTSVLAIDPLRASSGTTAANVSARPPAAAQNGVSDRRAARRESASAEWDMPASPGPARPVMSWVVRRSMRERSSSHSRVLPIPASPCISRSRPRPSCAAAIASSAASSWCDRPTSGTSGLGFMTVRRSLARGTRGSSSGRSSPCRGYGLPLGRGVPSFSHPIIHMHDARLPQSGDSHWRAGPRHPGRPFRTPWVSPQPATRPGRIPWVSTGARSPP